MRRVSFLMAFLITGYILGIWNFLILPKYYITFGLKGFLISLVPSIVAIFIIYSEAESTKRTRYLIHELLFKVARIPALTFVLLMFLMIMLGITTYYASYGLTLMLGLSGSYTPVVAVATILLVMLLLVMAKGHTLEFISVVSILFVIFAIAAVFLVREQAFTTVTSEQALHYMHEAVSSITSFSQPLSLKGILYLLISTFVSFGLGAGVYYVIGSFTPEDLDLKKVLAGVFILQIILSFAAAFTVAYSIGVAHEAVQRAFHSPNISAEETIQLSILFGDLKAYTTNSTQSPIHSINVFYAIPQVLHDNVHGDVTLIVLLMLSLYLAGLTTIIVLMEMGNQMLSEVVQIGRTQSLGFVSLFGMVVSGAMAIKDIRVMFLVVPFAVGALVAAAEAYPLLSSGLAYSKAGVWVSVIILLGTGLLTLYYAFTSPSAAVKVGALLGLVLFVPLTMNGMLLKSRR